ncbi:MAG: copper resistance protein CopC, partial [Propionibacteriaceae bacterium]|nr:copper resistance protein CopC [Propionibacteriaceae bacterium]
MSARLAPPRGRSRPARLSAVLLGALALLLLTAPRTEAHAQLQRTTPTDGAVLEVAPSRVELEFSEVVVPIDGAFRLFPAGAEPVPLAAGSQGRVVTIELPGQLPDDVYAVSYRVISADGHPISGALSFRVGEGDAPTAAPGELPATPVATEAMVVALTGLQSLGLLLFAGLLLFHRLVL